MRFMNDSINNFIELLVGGDFFLIFLIIMMVVIILVIVYLVRLQSSDTEYEKLDIDEEDDDDLYDYDIDEDEIDEKLEDEFEEVIKPINEKPIMMMNQNVNVEPVRSFEPVSSPTVEESVIDDYKLDEDIDELMSEDMSFSDLDDEDLSSLNLENPAASANAIRHIEQSKFNFEEPEEELEIPEEAFKSYEDEQEATAIISASELEERLNHMRATGEMQVHEEQIKRYEEEQEKKAIISYEELLKRASEGAISYESQEKLGDIRVAKVDTSNIDTYSETNDKPYYKEEAFLKAMKEFRRAL